jgi:hypothetical protein
LKRLVGLLCYLSFLSVVGFACLYAYLVSAPFFKGAELRYFNDTKPQNVDALARQLAVNGVSKSDSGVLRGYVTAPRPDWVARGWNALNLGVVAPYAGVDATNIAWAAVADAKGKVVASYPREVADTAWSPVEQHTTNGWVAAVGVVRRGAGAFRVVPIHNSHGKLIGSVAVAMRSENGVTAVPPEAELHAPITPFQAGLVAIISLLAFAILLPTWVAMDSHWRGMRPFAWVCLIIFTGPIGLAAYLISRLAPPRDCPNCGRPVLAKFKRCPSCGVSLPSKCPVCNTQFKPGWRFCPKCNAAPPEAPSRTPALDVPVDDALSEESGSTLAVTALDADGAPVSNVRIVAQGPSYIDGLTNSQGQFDAHNLPLGRYTVSAAREGYDSDQIDIEVEQGVHAPVRLFLKMQQGAIIGRVLTRTALQPIPGAKVFVDSVRLDRSAVTDADGAFVLNDIPPGPYTVCAEASGFARQSRLAEVTPGQRVPVDFALEAEIAEQEGTNAAQ